MSDRTLAPGQSFNFRAAVFNDGEGGAAATRLCYYVSEDPTLTPPSPLCPGTPSPPPTFPLGTSDAEVGRDAVRVINWSAAFTEEDLTSQEDIQLTAPTMAGEDYYYYACVAPVPGETGASLMNNCSATTSADAVRVLVGDVPDLVVEGPSVSDDILGPGQSFNFRVGVVNLGNGDSEATVLRYFFSENDMLETTGPNADTLLDSDDVRGLAAADWPSPVPDPPDESTLTRQVTELTAPTAIGFYHYFACVDSVAGEVNDTDNCTSIEVEVAGGPDLAIESASASATDLLLGQAFTFSATVVNRGNGTAAATTLHYYRSFDADISTEDLQVGLDPVEQLAQGDGTPRDPAAESDEDISLNAPASGGTYYYGACVVPVAGERAIGNNCSTGIEVRVRGAPDLRIEHPLASSGALGLGQAFTFSVTVFNAGDVGSIATALHYYRSEDAVISDEDVQVGEDYVGALAPGNISPRPAAAESRQDIALRAPTSVGIYYYYACVVAVRTETVVENNCSAAAQVDVSAHPDLVVQIAEVENAVLSKGESFVLRADVVNVGGGHADASVLRYYLSYDAIRDPDGDVEVGTDPVREIRYSVAFETGGEELTSKEDIRLNAPDKEGVYYYYACVGVPKPPFNSTLRQACGDDYGLYAVRNEVNHENNRSDVVRVRVVGDDPDLSAEGPAITTGDGVGGGPGYRRGSQTHLETVVGAGQTFTFGVGVVNRGNGNASPTTLRHYRYRPSQDPIDDEEADDVCQAGGTVNTHTYESWIEALGGDPVVVEGLRASSSHPVGDYDDVDAESKVRLENELIAPTKVGRYCYGACVAKVRGEKDSPNSAASEFIAENCSEAVHLEVAVGADLEVESVGVKLSDTEFAPSVGIRQGGGFSLRAVVTNYGRIGSAPATLRWYRSTDSNISAEYDDEVGRGNVEQLLPKVATQDGAGSASTTLVSDFAAPSILGSYHYGACVDVVPGETNLKNNCSGTVRVDVVGPPPDLHVWLLPVRSLGVNDSTLGTGQTFRLRAVVENQGMGDSDPSTLRYHQSRSVARGAGAQTEIERYPVREIRVSPGSSEADRRTQADIALQAPDEAGVYYYYACVDAVAGETLRNNNCSESVPVLVGDTPNLIVEGSAVSPSGVLGAGQSFAFSVVVVNRGDGDAPASALRYYRSTDRSISSADALVGDADVPVLQARLPWNTLDAKSRSRQQIALTAPTDQGDFYYGGLPHGTARIGHRRWLLDRPASEGAGRSGPDCG